MPRHHAETGVQQDAEGNNWKEEDRNFRMMAEERLGPHSQHILKALCCPVKHSGLSLKNCGYCGLLRVLRAVKRPPICTHSELQFPEFPVKRDC